MKHDKSFYKELTGTNGFKWSFFDEGLHCLSKPSSKRGEYLYIYLKDEDIEDPVNLDLMTRKGISRVK